MRGVDDVTRFTIHGITTDDGVERAPLDMVPASDYDALLRERDLLRDDFNAAVKINADLALALKTMDAEMTRRIHDMQALVTACLEDIRNRQPQERSQ
jgi:hypothetical protein